MLRFTDSKLKRKPGSEINFSKQRSPGKTCMTDTVINMLNGQHRQRVFSPLERVDHTSEKQPQPAKHGYRTDDDPKHLSFSPEVKVTLCYISQYGELNCTPVLFGLPPLARALNGRLSCPSLP